MQSGAWHGRLVAVVALAVTPLVTPPRTTGLRAQGQDVEAEDRAPTLRRLSESLFVLDAAGRPPWDQNHDGVLIVGSTSAMLVQPVSEGVLQVARRTSPVPIEHVVWTGPTFGRVRQRFAGLRQWATPGHRLRIAEQRVDQGPLPTELIDDDTVDLGGITVRMQPVFAERLEVDARVEIVESKTLILPSRLFAFRGDGRLHGPSFPPERASLREWRNTLSKLADGGFDRILLGYRQDERALHETIALLGECLAKAMGESVATPLHDDQFVIIDMTMHDMVDGIAPSQVLEPGDPLKPDRTYEWGRAPHQIAFAPTTTRQPNWAVALAGSDVVVHGGFDSEVYAGSSEPPIRTSVPGTPLGVAFMPDGDLAVTSFASNTIARVRGAEVVESIEVGEHPSLLQGPLPLDRYLVSCEASNECVVFDARGFSVDARFPTGERPFPAGYTQDGRLAFVPNHDDGTVTVIDLWNEVVVDTVAVGEQPTGALVLPSETGFDKYCLIACRGSDEIVVLNTASRLVEARISTPGGPFSMVHDAEKERILFNLTEIDAIGTLSFPAGSDRIDLWHLDRSHTCNDLPICLILHPTTHRLWVSHEGSHDVTIYDLEAVRSPTRHWSRALPSSRHPNALGVLGMIHRSHRTSETWGTDELERTIRAFRPDVVITEIPPDRWDRIWRDYGSRGVFEDPRIRPFVEYTDVLLPLKIELGFVVEPCAAWTTEMNQLRRARIAQFDEQPEFEDRRARYREAERIAEGQTTLVDTEDPFVIHTDAYDEAMAIRLGPYDSYLNEHIGPGGWTNINRSHADLIEAAVARHPGKRVLITFGAGHKYWIQNRLRRLGYALEDMRAYLPR